VKFGISYAFNSPTHAKAGDCVRVTGSENDPDISVKSCDDKEANYKVVKLVDDTFDTDACPGTDASLAQQWDQEKFVLCLNEYNPASSGKTSTAAHESFTAAQAKGIMLTAEDLAADGWSRDKDLSEGNSVSPSEVQIGVTKDEECQPLLDSFMGGDAAPKPQKYVSGGYGKGEDGPFLLTAVGVYHGDEAEQVMKTELPAEGTCAKVRATADGETDTYTRGKAPKIEAGDASRTVRMTMAATAEYGSIQFDTVAVRVDNAVIVLVQYSLGTGDQKALEAAVGKAVDKARQVSKS
jgi:hypothetical protein